MALLIILRILDHLLAISLAGMNGHKIEQFQR